MMWIAYAAAWLSTGTAVSFGIYYTHSASCLWALMIPAALSLMNRHGDAINVSSSDDEVEDA
jgi:hypothetical protein